MAEYDKLICHHCGEPIAEKRYRPGVDPFPGFQDVSRLVGDRLTRWHVACAAAVPAWKPLDDYDSAMARLPAFSEAARRGEISPATLIAAIDDVLRPIRRYHLDRESAIVACVRQLLEQAVRELS